MSHYTEISSTSTGSTLGRAVSAVAAAQQLPAGTEHCGDWHPQAAAQRRRRQRQLCPRVSHSGRELESLIAQRALLICQHTPPNILVQCTAASPSTYLALSFSAPSAPPITLTLPLTMANETDELQISDTQRVSASGRHPQ